MCPTSSKLGLRHWNTASPGTEGRLLLRLPLGRSGDIFPRAGPATWAESGLAPFQRIRITCEAEPAFSARRSAWPQRLRAPAGSSSRSREVRVRTSILQPQPAWGSEAGRSGRGVGQAAASELPRLRREAARRRRARAREVARRGLAQSPLAKRLWPAQPSRAGGGAGPAARAASARTVSEGPGSRWRSGSALAGQLGTSLKARRDAAGRCCAPCAHRSRGRCAPVPRESSSSPQ